MVLMRRGQGPWHEPESSRYDNEKALQQLVMLSPTLLPGGEELAVVDELPIPTVGFVDLVGVGSDGKVVIVECKLRANPEIRREIIGQVLSYAGGLWRMSVDDFEAAFAKRAGRSLHDAVVEATATELDEQQLRQAVAANLAAGSFRLVVAVDEITAELRTIIEYLNGHTLATVQALALELRYSRDGDVELLTPVVYGQEAAEQKARASSGARWTKATFIEAMQQRATPEMASFLQRIIDHGEAHGDHLYFGSGVTPGMSSHYSFGGQSASVWALYLYESGPRLALSLGSITSKASAEAATAWLDILRTDSTLNGLLASITPDDLQKYPQFPVSALLAPATQATFINALDSLRTPPLP